MTEAVEALPARHASTARRCLRIPDDPVTIVATGPLTSDPLAGDVAALRRPDAPALLRRGQPGGRGGLDRPRARPSAPRATARAATTTSTARSTRRSTRPSTQALTGAECATLHDFEREFFFEGCLPVEVIASRGLDTLRFGPMKPVGLADPRTGRRPHAVVQLRQDDLAASHWSPGRLPDAAQVGRAEARLPPDPRARAGGVRALRDDPPQHLRQRAARPRADVRDAPPPGLFFAGQMSGVEGYVESAASGLVAGLAAASARAARSRRPFPEDTALGALGRYIARSDAEALPADEHRLRPAARAAGARARQGAEAAGDGPPRAREPRRASSQALAAAGAARTTRPRPAARPRGA